jgi:FkbM family methyltransferase
MLGGVRQALARGSRTVRHFRGKERVLRLADRALRVDSPQALVARIQGVTFELDTRDLIDFRLAYLGAHDSSVLDYLAAELPRNGIFWDVGANVGAISLLLASRRPDVRIESFEPSPSVRRRLTANLALNPRLAGRIRVHAVAVSDRAGEVDFFESAEIGNSGVGSLGRMHNTLSVSVSTESVRGDRLVEAGRAQRPSFVKIDVEGFELEVVRGLEGLLRESGPTLLFEHEPYRFRERGMEPERVIAQVRALGYETQWLDADGSARPIRDRDLGTHGDVIARPVT